MTRAVHEVAIPASSETAPVRLWGPILTAAAAVTLLLLLVVWTSPSAWRLLGAGRGLVPEAYYPASGFALVLATTFGHAVGWAGASALLVYGLTLLGIPVAWPPIRLVMTVVYLGLAAVPLLVFHVLYGDWLLAMPRVGLDDWLAAHHPDARWLLITAHPVVELSLVPLAVVFLAVLWADGDRLRQSPVLQTVAALALLGTSLAVALSLAIHSTLVHVRLS
jgi:hypothetical protein